ncbi:MAG: hypothetical protein PVJ33_06525 [Lysobacterales bacterium]
MSRETRPKAQTLFGKENPVFKESRCICSWERRPAHYGAAWRASPPARASIRLRTVRDGGPPDRWPEKPAEGMHVAVVRGKIANEWKMD